MITLWTLLGCGSPVVLPETFTEPVAIEVFLDGAPSGSGGKLTVQAAYDPSGEVRVPRPVGEGLTFEAEGGPTLESLGGRDVVTQRYVFRAKKGSYEVSPLVAVWTDSEGVAHEAKSGSVFVDVGVEAPAVGELFDIVDPPAVRRIPWIPVLSVGALFLGGLLLAFGRPRRRKEAVQAPPIPPDVAALQAWDAVRADGSLSDEDKARELSVIFRAYVESVLNFEATAWTTSEIVAHLRTLVQLPEGNTPRARRLLRATDRIKFAGERPTGELVADLDTDLRSFVSATRPSAWRVDPVAAPAPPPPSAFDAFDADADWEALTWTALDHGCAARAAAAGPQAPVLFSVDAQGTTQQARVLGGADAAANLTQAQRLAKEEGRVPWAIVYDGDDGVHVRTGGKEGRVLTFIQRTYRDAEGTLQRDGTPTVIRMESLR